MLCVRDVVPAEPDGRVDLLFSVDVLPGERVCLVGNRASKLLACIAGQSRISAGSIDLVLPNRSVNIDRLPTEHRARYGLVFVPGTRNIFAGLTVEENLRIAFAANAIPRIQQRPLLDEAMQFAPFLASRSKQTAGTLSGGEQRTLAIVRALLVIGCQAHKHRELPQFPLLLLDEPTQGLDVLARERLATQICGLKDAGVALLIADQEPAFIQLVGERLHDPGARIEATSQTTSVIEGAVPQSD